jgi:hypothetical protein
MNVCVKLKKYYYCFVVVNSLMKVIFQDAGDFFIHPAVIKQTFYSTSYYINDLHNTAHKLLMSIQALKSPFLLVVATAGKINEDQVKSVRFNYACRRTQSRVSKTIIFV